MSMRHAPGPLVALLALLSACGGGSAPPGAALNTPPVFRAGGLADATRDLLDGPVSIDLRPAFHDNEDPDALVLSLVSSEGADVADVAVDPATTRLVWTPIGPGEARAVVRATDPEGLFVDGTARILVTATIVTLVLAPSADATLYPDTLSANGAGDHVFVGTVAGSVPLPRRGVFRFDLSAVPTSGRVLEVSLELYVTRRPFIGPRATFTAHRLTRAFVEGTTDAQANEGTGDPAMPGDATWTHASWPTEPWSTEGGDFDPTPSGSEHPLLLEPSVAIVGEGLTADVERWLAGEPAHGWILLGDETLTRTVRRFGSRTNPQVDQQPRLRIRMAVR